MDLNIATTFQPARAKSAADARNLAVGDVAHDLRGLITVIKGYAELVQEEATPAQQSFCARILRSCGMMNELVENCLELGRIEAGRLSFEAQEVDLREQIEDCLATHGLRARDKSITLVVNVENELPPLQSDPVWLERILGNLLSNAIKFSPPRSTITITARCSGERVEVHVADQGPGIAEAEIPRLFEAYRRGSARPTGGEKTTGLGLAIVKKLVEGAGGQIRVESELGHGATFSVELPIRAPRLARSAG